MSRAASMVETWPTRLVGVLHAALRRRPRRTAGELLRPPPACPGRGRPRRTRRARRRRGSRPGRSRRCRAGRSRRCRRRRAARRGSERRRSRRTRAGRARAAGVDDQRADPRVRVVGRVLEQRELDGLAARVLVVDRHRERRALEVAATRLPGRAPGRRTTRGPPRAARWRRARASGWAASVGAEDGVRRVGRRRRCARLRATASATVATQRDHDESSDQSRRLHPRARRAP